MYALSVKTLPAIRLRVGKDYLNWSPVCVGLHGSLRGWLCRLIFFFLSMSYMLMGACLVISAMLDFEVYLNFIFGQ